MKWNWGAFFSVLLLTPILGLWLYYGINLGRTIMSDLPAYGVEYGSDAYNEIPRIADRQARTVGVPLAIAYVVSIIGWGFALFGRFRQKCSGCFVSRRNPFSFRFESAHVESLSVSSVASCSILHAKRPLSTSP